MKRKHLDDKEKTTIEVLAADGQSARKIGKVVHRSHHTVEKHLQEPEVARKVQDQKTVLAERYREEARRILDSISPEDISKGSLLQKMTSSAIATDKSLLLAGEATQIDIHVLLEAVRIVREMRRTTTPQLTDETEENPVGGKLQG